MPDFNQQLRDFYDARTLPADQVEAILRRGRAVAGQGASPEPEEKIVRFPRFWKAGLSLAAAVAVFAGIAQWWPRASAPVSYAALAPRVIEFFGTPSELPKRSQNPQELRAWLIARGAPKDFQIPAKLQAMSSFGCQVLDVQGRPAYLTCFWREKKPGVDEGELVHLLVANRADFGDAPPSATPQFRELNGWSFASWSEGGVIYTLAAAAPPETLRPFVQAPSRVSPLLARL